MIKTSIICDICKKEVTEDPYGVSFGKMSAPDKHIKLQLCKEHYQVLLDNVASLLDLGYGKEA